MSDIPLGIRLGVREREMDMCLRCAAAGTDIHHRLRRRDGGHTFSNCILLCRTCHRWAHQNPMKARGSGFIVSFSGDPADEPIRTWRGPLRLGDEGGIVFITGVTPTNTTKEEL